MRVLRFLHMLRHTVFTRKLGSARDAMGVRYALDYSWKQSDRPCLYCEVAAYMRSEIFS